MGSTPTLATLKYLTKLISLPQVVSFSTTKQSDLDEVLSLDALATKPVLEMEQVHGDKFAFIEKIPAKLKPYAGVDALFTKLPEVVLKVRTADCLPVLLAHPSGLIGVIHCSRKNTELGILQKTLEHLKSTFSLEKGLQLWFGPAICERCYQIDKDKDLHFNLVRKNFQQVMTVFPDGGANVSPSSFCTVHQNEHFYSYRVGELAQGRNYSLICWSPSL